MKRLLLINAALQARNVAGVATMEPLGLAYVAALTPPGWDVRLVDEVAEPLPPPAACDADLVGISTLTATAPHAYELAAGFRARGIPVVIGGAHATLVPDEVSQYADVVFRGEAEGAWPELIADFEAGRLQARYEGGGPSLAGLPRPRRDLYRRRYALRLVSASRGCRYRCEFCGIWKLEGGVFRCRPVEEVWAELAQLSPRPPAGGWLTLFTDDNIMADRDWALTLFQGIAERGLRRRIAVQASLSVADDDELLDALHRAGCFVVMSGLESVNAETLRAFRKGVNLGIGPEHYAEKIRAIHRHGMMVAGTFIFGSDADSQQVFDQTTDFVLRSGLDLAHFGVLSPDLGTDVRARLEAEGRLLPMHYPADYRKHQPDAVLFTPRQMTAAELSAGTRRVIEAVSDWPVVARRSLRTWRETGDPFAAVISLAWTRSGLRGRLAN